MRFALIAVLCAACGDDGGSTPIVDAGVDAESWGAEDLRGACEQNTRTGDVQLNHLSNGETGAFTAFIHDKVEPNRVFTPLEESGECRIWRKVNPVCEEICGAQTCGLDGQCEPRPVLQDVGAAIEVLGLDAPLSVPNTSDQYQNASLPNPPFVPGQRVRVVAPGSETHEGFELRGIGVPLVEVPDEKPLMQRDTPFNISWDTTGSEGNIWVRVTVDQHGNSPVSLICVGEDDGLIEIDASIVNTFLDYGITGVPNYYVERRTADSVMIGSECIELRVHASALGVFDVEGHTPCTAAMPDCPEPLVCDLLIETCVQP